MSVLAAKQSSAGSAVIGSFEPFVAEAIVSPGEQDAVKLIGLLWPTAVKIQM